MPIPSELPQMSWGTLRMFGASIETDASRTIVVHDLSSGSRHPTTDRGERAKRVRLHLQFDDFPGQPPPYDALRLLVRAKASGQVALFSHPIEGNFQARIGEFSYVLDESSVPSATAEFIQEDDLVGVSPAGPSTSSDAGEGAVSAAADVLDQELAAVNARPLSDEEVQQFIFDPTDVIHPDITPDAAKQISNNPYGAFVTDDARVAVAAWGDVDTTARQVLIDTARISDRTAFLIEEQNLEKDIELFGAFRAAILFGDAVLQAGRAATSDTPSVFVMRVVVRTALLALVARVYGGANSELRMQQIMSLNDIPTPGWLAPGDYIMPTPSQ